MLKWNSEKASETSLGAAYGSYLGVLNSYYNYVIFELSPNK